MSSQKSLITYSFRNQELNGLAEIRSCLLSIWGIGWWRAITIINKLGLAYPFFTYRLNAYYFHLINYLLTNLLISKVKAQRSITMNIKKLITINCYIGKRHKLNLPVRGQRTRTNAKTQKRLKLSN